MGTHRVQMKVILGFVELVVMVEREFSPALAAPQSAQYKYFFPPCICCTLFQFMCPHQPATWAVVVQGRLTLNVCLRLHSKAPHISRLPRLYSPFTVCKTWPGLFAILHTFLSSSPESVWYVNLWSQPRRLRILTT
jgi:hypothetical protein